ncbi:hypothetical protein [Halostella litorea]|uniref:hypothetical protein n=1 Tax=Halostella litorea TaxID=2528831 RepID=UPI0010921D8F|nr:hypothetical protein [Halostella litorea]
MPGGDAGDGTAPPERRAALGNADAARVGTVSGVDYLTLVVHVHENCERGDVRAATAAARTVVEGMGDRVDGYGLSWTLAVPTAWPADRATLRREWQSVVDSRGGDAVHLFLVNAPGDYGNGYGHRIERVGDGDGATVANVGAARYWDGPAVARNIVVHETLHAFDADHRDGTVAYEKGDDGPAYADVSPMATAYVRYAGPECGRGVRACADTTWPGTGRLPEAFSGGTPNGEPAAGVRGHTDRVADAAWGSVRTWLDGVR